VTDPRGAQTARTRAVVTQYLEALNAHDPDRIVACVTPDYYNEHTSTPGTSVRGRDAYRARLPEFLAQFRDLHYEVEDVIVEDDRAAVPYTMSFRYVSDADAAHDVTIRGMFRFRVADDAIAHRVDYWDSHEFDRQVRADSRVG
jgi:steroid delta-isomerase-like uncharacterized protein